jgi:hypothetical protein
MVVKQIGPDKFEIVTNYSILWDAAVGSPRQEPFTAWHEAAHVTVLEQLCIKSKHIYPFEAKLSTDGCGNWAGELNIIDATGMSIVDFAVVGWAGIVGEAVYLARYQKMPTVERFFLDSAIEVYEKNPGKRYEVDHGHTDKLKGKERAAAFEIAQNYGFNTPERTEEFANILLNHRVMKFP